MNMSKLTHKISLSPASVLPDLLCEQPLLQCILLFLDLFQDRKWRSTNSALG